MAALRYHDSAIKKAHVACDARARVGRGVPNHGRASANARTLHAFRAARARTHERAPPCTRATSHACTHERT
eukprot:5260240-Prymnesium_polylepis.1